ncbi:hypothetical protein E0Z10_g69 [Xylaria hypoxylon]|uniref:Uncharacterized protein n=1 Tax=Xylaria hypoxylon TaxID=37992 RepID=A0A4Z0ZAQ9_9PEZI|nr:hypothetical protein E0Z10_g69 [Xylaria hypoxylon]
MSNRRANIEKKIEKTYVRRARHHEKEDEPSSSSSRRDREDLKEDSHPPRRQSHSHSTTHTRGGSRSYPNIPPNAPPNVPTPPPAPDYEYSAQESRNQRHFETTSHRETQRQHLPYHPDEQSQFCDPSDRGLDPRYERRVRFDLPLHEYEQGHRTTSNKHENCSSSSKQEQGTSSSKHGYRSSSSKKQQGTSSSKKERGTSSSKHEHGSASKKKEHHTSSSKQGHSTSSKRHEHRTPSSKHEHRTSSTKQQHHTSADGAYSSSKVATSSPEEESGNMETGTPADPKSKPEDAANRAAQNITLPIRQALAIGKNAMQVLQLMIHVVLLHEWCMHEEKFHTLPKAFKSRFKVIPVKRDSVGKYQPIEDSKSKWGVKTKYDPKYNTYLASILIRIPPELNKLSKGQLKAAYRRFFVDPPTGRLKDLSELPLKDHPDYRKYAMLFHFKSGSERPRLFDDYLLEDAVIQIQA